MSLFIYLPDSYRVVEGMTLKQAIIPKGMVFQMLECIILLFFSQWCAVNTISLNHLRNCQQEENYLA
jgi:hypothetical protein